MRIMADKEGKDLLEQTVTQVTRINKEHLLAKKEFYEREIQEKQKQLNFVNDYLKLFADKVTLTL